MNRRQLLVGSAAGLVAGALARIAPAAMTEPVEAGTFFAPYIPILCNPTFHDCMKLTPRQLNYFQRANGKKLIFIDDDLEAEVSQESITDDGMALRQRRVR
jgi:hypothetical protein